MALFGKYEFECIVLLEMAYELIQWLILELFSQKFQATTRINRIDSLIIASRDQLENLHSLSLK